MTPNAIEATNSARKVIHQPDLLTSSLLQAGRLPEAHAVVDDGDEGVHPEHAEVDGDRDADEGDEEQSHDDADEEVGRDDADRTAGSRRDTSPYSATRPSRTRRTMMLTMLA